MALEPTGVEAKHVKSNLNEQIKPFNLSDRNIIEYESLRTMESFSDEGQQN